MVLFFIEDDFVPSKKKKDDSGASTELLAPDSGSLVSVFFIWGAFIVSCCLYKFALYL